MMKRLIRFSCFALAMIMMLALAPLSVLGADVFPMESLETGYWGPKDTPLLVILINYDLDPGATGESGEMLLQHEDHSYWSNMFFGNDPKGLKAYYETQSGGNFRFIPAQENYVNDAQKDKANDGIIEVSVKNGVYSSTKNSTSDPERDNALRAAVENGYVDLSVYDTNGDKKVEESELVIAFIGAGYESTRSSKTPSYNAHASNLTFSADGITVSTGYIKCGEMMNDGPLTVGSFCHELGHVLGNGDLYAAGAAAGASWGASNAPAGDSATGGLSIMAGTGSSGTNKGGRTGASPANFDPYHATVYGLYSYTSVGNGEYTLYSRQSKEGTYNILKVTTPNPNEYYLIENRYYDNSSSHFDSDTNYVGTRGILIWHVDQTLADKGRAGAGMRINTPGHNADIGVAALRPAAAGENRNPAGPGVFNSKGLVFDCRGYKFPGSETWHTSLTEEQAENFNLKIEILDDPGHEMKIKVTGAYEEATPRMTYRQTPSYDSIHCDGQIIDLNTQVLYSMTAEIAETADFAQLVQSIPVTPDSTGSFSVDFTGLKDGTEYYIRFAYETQNGMVYDVRRCKTNRFIPEDTTSYEVSFYRNTGSTNKAFKQTVKVGEAIVPAFTMNKVGYVFAGWYADEELTEYYDVSKGKDDHADISLYAKWVKKEEAAKLVVVGAQPLYTKADPTEYAAVGETFREPPIVMGEKAFLGWYADEALTTPFDFSKVIDSVGEVKIYAKWQDDTATTTASSAVETTTADTVSTESTNTEPEKSMNAIPLVIAAVAAAGVAVTAVLIVLAKKKR